MTIENYFQKYSHQLYAYLLTHTRDHYTAEDLLQDTFLKAFLAIQDKVPENIEAWLMTIAKYTMFDYFKKQRRITIQAADFFAKQAADGHVEDQLLAADDIQETIRLLAKLPKKQQKAIAIVQIKGFTYQEASEMLAVSVNTLKSQVKRGREQIKLWKREDV